VPEKIANHLHESLQQTVEKLPRIDSAIQTLATIVVDTGETVAGVRLDHMAFSPNWFSIDAFIPDSAAAHPTCTVVLRVHAGLFRNTKRSDNYDGLPASLVFGPCAWYSTYGVPGRGVAQWLDSTGYLATSTRWPYGGSEYGGFEYAMLPSQEHGPHERWDNMIAMYGPAGTRLAACAAGRPNACTNYMLAAQSAVAVSARRASEARGRITLGRGPGTNHSDALLEIMMARMERDLGPARFDQFWKSNLSVPAAFAAASGEPLEDWVRRHLIAMTAPYHAGPLPGETVLLISALAALMLLSFGVYEVGKRGRF
jgi:hypothetical protein